MNSNIYSLPNLIIAGVHRAGSTALYTYLAKHPQICQSYVKEINFFVALMKHEKLPEMEDYARYFCHCKNELYRMEASPSYLYGKEKVAEAIKNELHNVKIIIILREPTDRLVSTFNRAVADSRLPENTDFHEFLSISQSKIDSEDRDIYSRGIREGMYIDFIRPWQRIFGDDLKIVFFDDLKNNAFQLIRDICVWLDLDYECFKPQDFTVENKTVQYRSRRLHRFVNDLYLKHEGFWRRHHLLKTRVRDIYNMFNADAKRKLQTVDEVAISKLRLTYAPYNEELKLFLESIEYQSLPSWLK